MRARPRRPLWQVLPLGALLLSACADTSSGDSLAAQQAAQGWGPDHCPAPGTTAVGYDIGEQLGELVLYDCAGEPVDLRALCGADTTWLSFAHAWCPHCVKAGSEMERIHRSYVAEGHDLASVSVVVEDITGGRPDESDCSAWREQQGQDQVITLYDDDTDSFVLWDENYTNLNIVLSQDRVILTKLHTDIESDIRSALEAAMQ